MINTPRTNYILLPVFLLLAISCNNHKTSIPFPEKMELPLPVTKPLQFTAPTKLSWPESTPVKPVVKKFDLNKLPSRPFDSSGFVPFSKPPEQVPLNWYELPDTAFNYDQLPSQPLKFEISVLEPPQLIKTSLRLKNNSGEIIYELGEPLVNNNVSAMLEDKNGFLWIASNQGLYRYDGENLLRYVRRSIISYPASMIEDNNGQLWIAAENGIYVLNPQAGILKHLTVNEGLIANNLFEILLDKQGRIWTVGAYGNTGAIGGVNIIDEKSAIIKRFGAAQGLSNFFASDVMQDNLDNIWITTLFGGGVDIVDLKNGKIKYLRKRSGLISDSVTAMLRDAENNIWIADISGKLNVINRIAKTITYYGAAQGLKRNNIWRVVSDDQQNIWLSPNTGAAHGVEIINPGRNLYKNLNTKNELLSGNEISNPAEDRRGQIWLGTDGGLNMMHRNGSIMEHTGNAAVSSVAEDRLGRTWIGLEGAGIEIIDSATRTVSSFTAAYGLANDTVENIRLIEGKLCITSSGGIDFLDSNFTTITHVGNQQGLSFHDVDISKDSKGLFWISSASGKVKGFDVYNPTKQTVQHLGVEEGIKDSAVLDIIEDRQGNIWFTSVRGSAGVIDAEHKTVKYIKEPPGFNEPYNKLLMKDSQGNMWIGTGKGIYVVNRQGDSVTSITSREGLIDDDIVSLNQYKDRIFAATKGGLTIITPAFLSPAKEWKFESFGPEQGTSRINGSWESDMVTTGGRFLLGDAGVTSLSDGKRFTPSPGTEVTGIDIFNRPQYFSNNPWGSLQEKDTLRERNPDTFYVKGQLPSNLMFLEQSHIEYDSVSGIYNMPVNLSLPYFQNYLQFHFTQVQGDDDEQDTTWYRYILEGTDKSWSDRTFSSTSKNYYSLAPGNYIFKVASLLNGQWSKPAEFSFTIMLPWWRTWWAYILFALALFGIVYVAVQYPSRKLKAANVALDEKINQRTAELKKSLQDLKATQTQLIQSEKMASLGELTAGIAHEIQNPLNFVNNFSEVSNELIEELKSEKSKVRSRREMSNIEKHENSF